MNDLKSILFALLGIVVFIVLFPFLMWLFIFFLIIIVIVIIYSRYKLNKLTKNMQDQANAFHHTQQAESKSQHVDDDDVIDVEYSEREDES